MAKKLKPALIEINGREDTKTVFTTLDQVWGKDISERYGTLDESVYRDRLNEMGRTELWQHCTKIGLPPHDNIGGLKQKLLATFRQYLSEHSAGQVKQQVPDSDIPDHIRKILQN